MDFEDMTEEQLSAVLFCLKSIVASIESNELFARKYGEKNKEYFEALRSTRSLVEGMIEEATEAVEVFR